MTFDDMLNRTTHRHRNAVISVGVIQGGEAGWTLYGKDAAVLSQEEHSYAIGSVTKTLHGLPAV